MRAQCVDPLSDACNRDRARVFIFSTWVAAHHPHPTLAHRGGGLTHRGWRL